ncbi:MAG: hypothetical protein ACJ746_19705 [Bryobacteraceae bacterium]
MDETGHSPLVLYVEDDPTTSYLFKMAVEELNCGINLVVVSDGDAAGAFLHRKPPFEDAGIPDLVILDLNLPGREGFFHKPRDVDSFWRTVKQICDMFARASRASTA